jgi:hypothetical protein
VLMRQWKPDQTKPLRNRGLVSELVI